MHFQNPALYAQRVILVCITCLSISNFGPVPQFCYYSGFLKLLFTIHLDIKRWAGAFFSSVSQR